MADIVLPPQVTATLGDKWVTFANALTRAIHNLTLGEKRLIAACIAQVKSDAPVPRADEPEKKTYTVTADQYAELYGVKKETAYSQMKENQATLWKKEIQVIEKTGKKGRKVRWVQEIQYNDGEASVTLMWTDMMCTVLFNLRKEFTTYRLRHGAQFTNKYTWDLFDMLAMWRRAGKFTINVDELRDKLNVAESQRKNYKELRTRVLEPAVAEIHEKNGLVVTIEERKKGRKVVELAFSWEADPQTELNF
ncbi:replication initiation protein [Caballeronia sp. TF1N1]|uniref:replication initiation protein n=1 Tax=Caballeronia sp. TF1N1 TaxID=2878153 RepID=UPI001FD52D26|nr:replication initiation protein [Caballeronia sp. TF1N1]